MSGLQHHLSAKAGEVYDAGNINVADRGEIFIHTDAGAEGTFPQRYITDMGGSPQRGINGDYQCIGMIQMDKVDGGFQVFGMDGFLQRTINMEAFLLEAALVEAELMSDDGAKAISGSAVGADANKNNFSIFMIKFFQQVLERRGKVKKSLRFSRIKILNHNHLPFCYRN